MDRSRLSGRKPKPLSKHAHRLVRFIDEKLETKYAALSEVSGVGDTTIAGWRLLGSDPKLSLIEAVLNAMGYDLVAVKRKGEEDED